MIKIDNVLNGLNIADRMVIHSYIKQEVNRQVIEREVTLQKNNQKIWEKIIVKIRIAMREFRISEERIDKIFERITKLIEEHNVSEVK